MTEPAFDPYVDAACSLLELYRGAVLPPELGVVISPDEQVLRYHLVPGAAMDWQNAFMLISKKVEELGWHCSAGEFIKDHNVLVVVVVKVEAGSFLVGDFVDGAKVAGEALHEVGLTSAGGTDK